MYLTSYYNITNVNVYMFVCLSHKHSKLAKRIWMAFGIEVFLIT